MAWPQTSLIAGVELLVKLWVYLWSTVEESTTKRPKESLFIVDNLGQPKIRKLHKQRIFTLDQYVVGFDVAVSNFTLVKIFQSLTHLESNDFAVVLNHRIMPAFNIRPEVAVGYKLHYDNEMGLIFILIDILHDVRLFVLVYLDEKLFLERNLRAVFSS